MIIHENNEDERTIYLWFTNVKMNEFLEKLKDLEINAGIYANEDPEIFWFYEGAQVKAYLGDEWFEDSKNLESEGLYHQLASMIERFNGVNLITEMEGHESKVLFVRVRDR